MTRVNEFLATRRITDEFIGFLAQRGALGFYYDNCVKLEDESRDEVKNGIFLHARPRQIRGYGNPICMTDILSAAFLWSQTEQGFEFWNAHYQVFQSIIRDKRKYRIYELLGIGI